MNRSNRHFCGEQAGLGGYCIQIEVITMLWLQCYEVNTFHVLHVITVIHSYTAVDTK